jgi:NADPH:quinone reductase-like Zn-dependent oxidoreductase
MGIGPRFTPEELLVNARALAVTGPDTAPEVVDVEVPAPGPGEVTLSVDAGTFNGIDAAIAAGYLWGMPHEFPVALGRDVAGVVSAVGEGVDDPAVGDRVAGVIAGMTLGPGSVGSAMTIASEVLTRIPEGIAPEQAASVGLAGCTAVDVVAALEAEPGSRVLVAGATGGVGAFVVQLLADAGVTVLATARDEEAAAFLRDLGATQTVGYDELADTTPVDAVAHLAGDAGTLATLVKPGGFLVSVLGADQGAVGRDDVTAVPVMATTEAAKVSTLLQMVADGKLRVPVTTYPLDQAIEAFTAFTGHKLGKVAVTTA